MPAEFQKTVDRTINHPKKTFYFLDDIFIVSKEDESEHKKLVEKILKSLNDENLALKISKCEIFKNQVDWEGHHLSDWGVTQNSRRQKSFNISTHLNR